MSDWTAEQLTFLHDVVEVRIAPLRDDGSAWPGRLIWVLELDGRVFVRSWKGAHAEWFERAMITHRARLTMDGAKGGGDFTAEVSLHPDQDPVTAAAIDAEFLRKYGDPYAKEMNAPIAAETTVELLPV